MSLQPDEAGVAPGIPEVTDVDIVFGGGHSHLPPYTVIPEEFRRMHCPQQRFFAEWFFKGLSKEEMDKWEPREGVDVEKAFRLFRSIIGSYAPKHEHKMAGLAWMFSWWFQEVKHG